jgi:hypothetical protein
MLRELAPRTVNDTDQRSDENSPSDSRMPAMGYDESYANYRAIGSVIPDVGFAVHRRLQGPQTAAGDPVCRQRLEKILCSSLQNKTRLIFLQNPINRTSSIRIMRQIHSFLSWHSMNSSLDSTVYLIDKRSKAKKTSVRI